MSEMTAVAESSSAPAVEVVEMPKSGSPDYAEWRVNGKLPEKPQPKAESAPAEKVDAGEATTPQTKQETRRRPDAESRIKELVAENKRLKAEREAPKTETKPQQQPAARTKPTVEDKNTDGTPKYKTYEDFVEDLSDWKAEKRIAEADQQRTLRQQQEVFNAEVEKARSRYENFDEVVAPTAREIHNDPTVNGVVKAMLRESTVLSDLLYTIGGDAAFKAKFIEMAKNKPGQALREIARLENLIEEELSVPRGTSRAADGKFTKEPEVTAPAKRGPESASEPPLDVGNRGTGTMDESGKALSAIAKGNPNAVREWMRAENSKDLRRRRGA